MKQIKWVIDSSKSSINFEVEHFIIPNVKGGFKLFNASIYASGSDFNIKEINFKIATSSIVTGDKYCDEQLKSADVFDAENYKLITFKAQNIEKFTLTRKFELSGDLTIKGITKNIKLEVDFEGVKKNFFGREKANFTIKGLINRNDWGLNLNSEFETWKILVSENVKINGTLQLKKSTIQDYELPSEKIKEQSEVAEFA